MELSLNGLWRVNYFPYMHDIDVVLEDDFVPEGWITAQIPEDIHATLRREGIIRGNTYGKTQEEEKWIEQKDWVYHKEFFVPEELKATKVKLCFEGIDTFCAIYLNGRLIGEHDNMFVPKNIDVKDYLYYGKRNVIVIRFFSPVRYVENMDDSKIFSITNSDRILARKAQMNYSWDFCGRCVTLGIWKKAKIYGINNSRISSYFLRTNELNDDCAIIGVDADIEQLNDEKLNIKIELFDKGKNVLCWQGSPEEAKDLKFTLNSPKLWWPNLYGEAYMYDFRISLYKDNTLVDEKRQRFGVRTIEVLQEQQSDGMSFQFRVNGKKLFIRGANWVPVNDVYTDITDEDYEDLIDYAQKGNISMLRIWGGGIYENHRFFECCDEKGILVWSDFMLSCGIYPQDNEFLEKMRIEGEYIVKEYRNYTSIALWSGDNEDGQAYGWAGRPYEFREDKITRQVLRDTCKRLDPSRFYLATSPDSPYEDIKGGDNPASPYQGDTHLYIMSGNSGERKGRDYGKDYYKRILSYRPRFVSEFGFVSYPEKDSFYRFNFHREPLRDADEMDNFLPIAGEYIKENDFDNVIYYSQLFNSMALKYWIEYFRSLKGICNGSLYWKFNDPLTSQPPGYMFPSHMSSVDMYRNTKMTYYYTKRAYEDILVAFVEGDNGLSIYGINETDSEITGVLTVTRKSFAGEELAKLELPCLLKADSSTLLHVLAEEEFMQGDKYGEYILGEFTSEAKQHINRYLFADVNEMNMLKLKSAELLITYMVKKGREFTLKLTTDAFIPSVRLNILDHRADYSDNYFAIDKGKEKTVVITLKSDVDIESAAVYIEGQNIKKKLLPLADFKEL